MPNYTNVSVYLNRYVSSEAANMPKELFDERTGYFKDPAVALQMAANMCCSKTAGFGVAVSPLATPKHSHSEGTNIFRVSALYVCQCLCQGCENSRF